MRANLRAFFYRALVFPFQLWENPAIGEKRLMIETFAVPGCCYPAGSRFCLEALNFYINFPVEISSVYCIFWRDLVDTDILKLAQTDNT